MTGALFRGLKSVIGLIAFLLHCLFVGDRVVSGRLQRRWYFRLWSRK